MRISTNTIYETGSSRIGDLQSNMNKLQQQISSGRKVLTPADDPIGSARALVITQADAINDQFAVNRQNAKNLLSVTDGVLGTVTDNLHSIKTLIVQAGNGVLSDADRTYVAQQLQSNLDQMISSANATDGTGNYLFSGFSTTTAPFTKSITGASYVGDQGQRYLQADSARQLPLSAPGMEVFGNIRTSNSQFNILPNPSNVGKTGASAAVDPLTAANITGHNYEVRFDNTAANFSVFDKTTGGTIVPPTPYTNPVNVTFDGINLTLQNSPTAPAPGDKILIQPGNQDIFETVTDVINALKTPATNSAARSELTQALTQANNNVDKSLSNVLTVRAQVGSSLKEIDGLDNEGDAKGVSFKQSLSEIQDIDYVKAISEFSQNQMVLQAAQQSFVKASSLSLFSYLS